MEKFSNFNKADYFTEIGEWFDRVEKRIDLEKERLETVRRAHTSLFREKETKYSRDGDYEIDALERMATTTDDEFYKMEFTRSPIR